MKSLIALLLFWAVTAGALGAQALEASATAFGPSAEEARELALTEAVNRAFRTKDALFKSLFYRDLELYRLMLLRVDTQTLRPDGRWAAEVRVELDPLLIQQIQRRYVESVSAILNEVEAGLTRLESTLEQARRSLEANRFAVAFQSYTEARNGLAALLRQMEPFADQDVMTDSRKTKVLLEAQVKLRLSQAEEALERLKTIEAATSDDRRQQELAQSLELFQAELEPLRAWVRQKIDQAPFYDVPAARLSRDLTELTGLQERLRSLKKSLDDLSWQAGNSPLLFKTRLEQVRTEVRALEPQFDRIKNDLETELREPRLVRLEKERQSRLFWEGVGKNWASFLVRETQEHVAVRWYWPLGLNQDLVSWEAVTPVSLRLEGFYQALWARTQYRWEERPLSDGMRTQYAHVQELSLGFGDPWVWGLGWQWDWLRGTYFEQPVDPQSRLLLHFGLKDESIPWHFWQTTLSYQIPGAATNWNTILNFGLDTVLRFGPHFKGEMGLGFFPVLQRRVENLASFDSFIDREMVFRLGVGVKIPNSLLWGLAYEHRSFGALGQTGRQQGLIRLYNELTF